MKALRKDGMLPCMKSLQCDAIRRTGRRGRVRRLGWAAALLAAAGCATNPVTNRSELSLVSEAYEVQLGRTNYEPMQQAQGGELTAFPDVEAYVQRVGQRLVEVSDRPHLPYEFTVLNNGTPNAWALPGGKIAVNRGLLTELENEAELAAVLSHEIVHAAAKHGAQAMQRGLLTQAALIGLGAAVQDHDYRDVIFAGAGLSAQLITQRYSRSAELEADRYGIQYMAAAGYDPQAAVTLQEKFVRLAEGREQDWLTGLFASHPPSRERVAKNQQLVNAMGAPGGTLGEMEYEAALAGLEEAQPAYDKLEMARAAMQRGHTAQALQFARQGMSLLPQEAQFYGIAAKAKASQGDLHGARELLDEAIVRDDEYYDFYLQRGYVRHQLGAVAAARQDLRRSADLLPTAQAHHALGMMELQAGNQTTAVRHFSFAAQTESPAGMASRRMLQRLGYTAAP